MMFLAIIFISNRANITKLLLFNLYLSSWEYFFIVETYANSNLFVD